MIDVLIPTFNRKEDLIKNIYHINNLIKQENLVEYFQLLVSDNASTDGSYSELKKIEKEIDVKIKIFRQEKNIGLEKNSIFLLNRATSDFIMYIGDDDYLPSGYLTFVVNKLKKEPITTAIIPGMSNLYADGSITPSRIADFDEVEYPPGFKTACRISNFGHQLSGILFKREGLVGEYLKTERLRNIYPFIFFLAYNNLRGKSYYVPKFKVVITQSNSKDWGYDDSGLLTEIFKNYNILYPYSPIKRLLLCVSMMIKQRWRLRIGENPKLAIKAFSHLTLSKDVDLLVKASLLLIYPYFYTRIVYSAAKRRIA